MKSDRKPPLVRSPMRIPPRRSLRSSIATPIRTPSVYPSKVEKPNAATEVKGKEIRPEYSTISCELSALAKMVEKEFGNAVASSGCNKSTLFERGRFYDAYSARRNEKLKRKKQDEMGLADEPKSAAYKLGVKVDSAKKSEFKKRESLVKSVSAAYSVDRSDHPRYALRSMKKPPLPLPVNIESSKKLRRR